MTHSGRFDAPGSVAEEIARLDLLRRLSMGAAHTLNNAFTAILGETLGLLDERKGDPLVAEACALIQAEVERCARLMRAIALRMHHRTPLIEEASLTSLLRSTAPLLRETVSRSIALACETPATPVCVRGAGEDVELLVLLCAHRLVHGAMNGTLRVSVEMPPQDAALLRIEFRDGAVGARETAANADWDALVEASVRTLSARHGIRVDELDAGDGARDVLLHFARATGD